MQTGCCGGLSRIGWRFLLWAWLVPGVVVSAQVASTASIKTVEFVGLRKASVGYAQDVAGVPVGASLDRSVLDEAVAKLLRTRRFLSARYTLHEEKDGVRVTFELRERFVITELKFAGNRKFRDGQLKEAVSIKIGDPVDGFAVRDGRDSILAKYKEIGFPNAQVSFDQTLLDQSGELFYKIEEGSRVRVTEIVFEGNTTFPERELKKQIESRTAIWIFRTGAFDEEQVRTDAGKLQNYFRDQGFLDARVDFRQEATSDGQSISLTFQIVEGTRYRVEDLSIQGNLVFSTDELRGGMKLQPGEFVKQLALDGDVKSIQTQYGELGYINALVRANRVFSNAPGLVQITLEIEEGESFRVGRVAVRGNTNTKDKVVRRALNLYPPDDLLNVTEMRDAEKKLVETRIFSSARVIPVGDAPGVRDLVVDVVESDKSGDLLFGVGVTSNSGLIGSIILDLNNFDLFDTPRSWSEFLKLKSFTGSGQRMRIELQPGTEVNRFSIDFTEPYFLDRPIRFDAGLYLFERDRDGYSEGRIGSTVSFGKRLERGRLRGWSGEVTLRAEDIEIDEVDLFASDQIRADKGTNILTSVKGSIVRDRTDNRLVPTTGDRLRLSYEQVGALGGDHIFGRAASGYSRFWTVYRDALDRKSVVHLRTEGGIIVGDAPVFERYYAGGIGSIRGFRFRGVGPRDGLDKNNVGGDFLFLASGEYSFPLYGDNLRGLTFLDTGTAGGGAYRAAAGVGIRLTIDLFGGIPMEFTLGMPVSQDGEDEEQVFGFSVGGSY